MTQAKPPNVHRFDSTGEAYDACQCDDAISDGDVLIIESECVVGVAHTWPIAVTVESGALHSLKVGASIRGIASGDERMLAGWHAARSFAISLGFGVVEVSDAGEVLQ